MKIKVAHSKLFPAYIVVRENVFFPLIVSANFLVLIVPKTITFL